MRYLSMVFALLVFSCHAASSEEIVPSTDKKTAYCQQVLNDHILISQAVANGIDRARLEALAKRATNIDDARKETIYKLIDEAYSASDPTDWLNTYWTKCMGEEI